MIAAYRRFNEWLASHITTGVATMTCAYFFAALALYALPGAIQQAQQEHSALPLVTWFSQTFLQLVLLSVIMVGQNIQQRRIDDLHDKHDKLHDTIKGNSDD